MRKHYIIGAALGLLALVSCSQKMEFNNVAFAAFDQKTLSVKEDAGTAKVDITAYGISAETPVTLSFGGTAKLGEDYTISGAEGGVVTFTESGTKTVTLNIVNHPGVYTGNLTVTLMIDSVPEGVEIGALKNLTVTIADNDHPLAAILGDYTMKGISNSSSGYGYYTWDLTLSPYEGNTTRVWINYTAPFFTPDFYGKFAPHAEVYGVVSSDLKTITIPCPQPVQSTAKEAFGLDEPFLFLKYDGNNLNAAFISGASEVVFKQQEDGSFVTTDSYGYATSSTLADGWLYYYLNVFGGFNANYPAFFIKK